ncbi:major facilitator superfamily domain-containing protein [Xylaria sp. FL0064]|nr:major facilitator superfamily domain-containing protein [Xylaria sp. FL0064]
MKIESCSSPSLEADTGGDTAISDIPLEARNSLTMDQCHDPNIVDWDGPDDPENPYNWPKSKKMAHVLIVSAFSLSANLASTMFAPGAEQLAAEFHFTSAIIETFTVSIYVLGFALGPIFLAPLSELYGRLVIYHICNVVYTAFTIGCAFSTNVEMFLVFRILCGIAASGPMSIGGGTVADITPQEERGKAIALFGIGPLLGPVIGPIVGGFVTQDVGWRWTFRIILILSGLLSVATVVFMRETNSAVLLRRKTHRLTRETGNKALTPKATTDDLHSASQVLRKAIIRPARMLLFSPLVSLLSLYTRVLFGLIFLLFTTFPIVFEGTYGFSLGVAGLAYLGLGIGLISGLVLFATLSDKLLGQKRDGTVARPEEGLILMKWFAPITPIGCSLFVVIPAQTYLIDAFGAEAAASALAANLVVRSPFGAFLVLAAPPLYGNLGLGWGNSLFYRYGEYLRKEFPVDL